MTTIRFTDVAAFLADETAEPSGSFAAAFTETADQVRLARTDDAITADMRTRCRWNSGWRCS